ncbi:hypothetical protein CRUP_034715 [Coryphaenoides rupestris]|nr:hypothetical protein CRUP_034715 [Coryphaenoides rupestris]
METRGKEEEVPESKPSGVYRPPRARLTTTKRGPVHGPPEIYSDTQFPSLLATSKHGPGDGEDLRGGKAQNPRQRGGWRGFSQQLQLDNQLCRSLQLSSSGGVESSGCAVAVSLDPCRVSDDFMSR